MDTTVQSLEERAMHLLAGVAVFWSFFIAAGMLVQTFQHMQETAYASAYSAGNYATIAQALPDTHRERMRAQTTPPPSFPTASSTIREDSDSNPHKRRCPRASMALQRGGQNMPEDVRALQQFLAERYAQKTEDLVTGHFGPLTERLLAKFQSEQGLPPVGILGPLTRAAIARHCTDSTATTTPAISTESTQVLKVVPSSGRAPLTTNITVSAGAGYYTLVFGDGATTTVAIPSIQCVSAPCNPPSQTVVHTYQNVGVYTATLTSGAGAIIGSTTITVRNSRSQ